MYIEPQMGQSKNPNTLLLDRYSFIIFDYGDTKGCNSLRPFYVRKEQNVIFMTLWNG